MNISSSIICYFWLYFVSSCVTMIVVEQCSDNTPKSTIDVKKFIFFSFTVQLDITNKTFPIVFDFGKHPFQASHQTFDNVTKDIQKENNEFYDANLEIVGFHFKLHYFYFEPLNKEQKENYDLKKRKFDSKPIDIKQSFDWIVSTFEKEENLGKIVNLLKDQQVRRSVELEVGQLSYDDLNPPYTLYVRTWYFSLQNEEPVLGHHYVTFRYAFENSNIGNMIECSEYRQNDSALVVSTFHVINSKARHVLNQVAQFSKAKFNIEPKLSQWEKITNHIFWILFQIEKKIKA